jgi:hypothetical protein
LFDFGDDDEPAAPAVASSAPVASGSGNQNLFGGDGQSRLLYKRNQLMSQMISTTSSLLPPLRLLQRQSQHLLQPTTTCLIFSTLAT